MLKYFLHVSESVTLAIKYSEKDEMLFFGGYKIFALEIRMVLEDYFEVSCEDGEFSYPQRNKMKYIFSNYSSERFYDAMKKLKEHDFILTATRSLERIMR